MKYILCLITLIASVCHSQKIEDISLKHSMKQDGLALQFTVLDPDKKGIRRYDTHKTYYWYKAQKVMGTQGGSSGQLLHGRYESFYLSKQLCEKGNYEKGLKDGDWYYWRADGSLLKTEQWRRGTQRGEQAYYSNKGLVQKRIVIRGRHIIVDCGDTLIEISGRSRTVTLMDSIGRITSVARYKNNLLHGKQETILSDGTKTVVSYKRGATKEAGRDGLKSDHTQSVPAAKDQSSDTDGKKQPVKNRLKGIFSKKDRTASGEEPKRRNAKKERQPEQPVSPDNGEEKKKWNPFKRKAE
jgi:antitoxin component YwqK of YwqJK toxin-antitoxin module